MEAQWSANWAKSELESKTKQKASLESKLHEIRDVLMALQREMTKPQRARPPPPPLEGSEAMAGGDLMAQFLSPQDIAKESREAAKANRMKGGPPPSTGASRAATFAMAEKALVAVRARERAAVRALDACLVSLERAEKEAAKAQAELEGKVKPR